MYTLLAGTLQLAAAMMAVAAADLNMAHYPRAATTNATTAFPTATGHASHNCSWSWSSWDAAAFSHWTDLSANVTSTYTYHNITASTTVGCDNITRIVGDLTTTATGTNVTVFENSTTITTFNRPTPTCSLAIEDCLSLFAFDDQEERFKYCTPPTTSREQVCGPCGIVGGTIDLLYFPPPLQTPAPNLCATNQTASATLCPLGPTTATNNATNPYDNSPCYYATGTSTTQNSGPYITSDGHTFYENRAYISLASVYATDRCGYIGDKHSGTIVEVASTDVYSIGGYHHYFADNGYSFNFQDLYNPPSSAYYLNCDGGGGMACVPQQGTRYTPGTDFINGVSNVDLGRGNDYVATDFWIWPEAYAPIILMPTQIRSLDPAWSTCILDLAGLYDPPRALTQTDAVAPTVPTPGDPYGGATSTAKPGSSPSNTGVRPTADPTTTSVAGVPVIQPSDDGPVGTPTASPVVQPTDDGNLDTPTGNGDVTPQPTGNGASDDGGGSNDGEGADSEDNTPPPQNAGGIVASLLNGGTDAAQQANSQPTGTTQGVGDIVASVLGMAASPSAQDPGGDSQDDGNESNAQDSSGGTQQADDPPAPTPIIFTGGGATHTAAAVAGSQGVYVVDGTQTVMASAADPSEPATEIQVDGETLVIASSQTGTGAGDNPSSSGPSSPGSATLSGSSVPQQTGAAAREKTRDLALIVGGALWVGMAM